MSNQTMSKMIRCETETEVYSRVVGFYRPVRQWNQGKFEEYTLRTPYQVDQSRKA